MFLRFERKPKRPDRIRRSINQVYSNPVVGAIPCGRPGRVQDPPLPTHFECTRLNLVALARARLSARWRCQGGEASIRYRRVRKVASMT